MTSLIHCSNMVLLRENPYFGIFYAAWFKFFIYAQIDYLVGFLMNSSKYLTSSPWYLFKKCKKTLSSPAMRSEINLF